MKSFKRTMMIVAGALFALAALAPAALAHAAYKDSSPKKGETVSSPPSEVWVEFTETPSEGASHLEIFDACGERVDAGDDRIDPVFKRITVSMNGEVAGDYRVDWYVLSNEDGHPTSGSFEFTSSGGSQCAREPSGSGESEKGSGKPQSGGSQPQDSGTNGAGGGEQAPSSSGESLGPNSEARGMTGPSSSRNGKQSPRRNRSEEGSPNANPNLAQGRNRDRESVAEQAADIPLDGLLLGLGFSMLIGAAGGRMYAGIMGPRR